MLDPQQLAALRRQRLWSAAASLPIYALVWIYLRLYYRYRFPDIRGFRAQLWRELGGHQGGLIWAANHLTMIDSFVVFWAVWPWSRALRTRLIPWSTPEYKNYYRLGGWLFQRLIRGLLYFCRCIPFLRGGEDEDSARWRENVFAKLAQLLRWKNAVFVYPEATRARNGWLEKRKPKDFLGRLALDAPPDTKFLCVYLRGEGQLYTTAAPARGESFRAYARLIPARLPEENSPRAISQRLFDTLAELQGRWFADAPIPKNCSGNDVVDIQSPLCAENMDPGDGDADDDWLDRHLTKKERDYFVSQDPARRYATFWKFFAAKEAAFKALAQSGIGTPRGAYTMIEADLFRRKATHLPTGCQLDFRFVADDAEKLHCVAVLRGGWIGDEQDPGDVIAAAEPVPPNVPPPDFARSLCLQLIAASSDDINSPDVLAFSEDDAAPKVLRGGKPQDWGVSLSHHGRFAAASFMIS